MIRDIKIAFIENIRYNDVDYEVKQESWASGNPYETDRS